MKIIFHNDDFAVSHGVNQGIKESFLNGLTTSASIRTNGPAFDESVDMIKNSLKKMGLGIHLNLTDGHTHLSDLANSQGFYKYNFFTYLIALKFDKRLIKSIYKELDFQFQKCKRSGLKPDHVDGQDHIQMIPEIFEVICKLCKKNKIRYIRVSREPYYLTGNFYNDLRPFYNLSIIKLILLNYFSNTNIKIMKKYNLKTTDASYGILHTNQMNTLLIKAAISDAISHKYKIIQIFSHPAKINNPNDKIYTSIFFSKYVNLVNRQSEAKALQEKNLKSYISKLGIRTVTFQELG